MRQYYKEEVGRPFKFEDSYQITKHELDHEENEIIFSYELNDAFKRFLTPELSERKSLHDEEVKQFGRFWLMEGFFSKKDKNLWLEAIDLLSTINELVREDIRDQFVYPKMEGTEQNESGGLNSSQNSNNELNTSTLSKQGSNAKKKNTNINIIDNNSINRKTSNTKLALVRKNTKRHDSKRTSKKKLSRKKTIKSHRDSKKLPDNIYVFRPPNIWNYPYHRLFKLKHQNEGENVITEIRNVDPTICYKDNV
jgi:hypothetical protein